MRIVIAEDAALFRHGLTLLLQDGGHLGRRHGRGRRFSAAGSFRPTARPSHSRRTDAAPPRRRRRAARR